RQKYPCRNHAPPGQLPMLAASRRQGCRPPATYAVSPRPIWGGGEGGGQVFPPPPGPSPPERGRAGQGSGRSFQIGRRCLIAQCADRFVERHDLLLVRAE